MELTCLRDRARASRDGYRWVDIIDPFASIPAFDDEIVVKGSYVERASPAPEATLPVLSAVSPTFSRGTAARQLLLGSSFQSSSTSPSGEAIPVAMSVTAC